MPAILFVCTANICRSPMAEAIFRNLLSQRADAADWTVASAGTWGMDGYRAASRARAALQNLGLSAEEHTGRTVTHEILQAYDLVLTMERGHVEALRLEFPQAADRIFLLTEMVGAKYDIQDPIGGSQDDFDVTARELRDLLYKGMEQITHKALKNASIRSSRSEEN